MHILPACILAPSHRASGKDHHTLRQLISLGSVGNQDQKKRMLLNVIDGCGSLDNIFKTLNNENRSVQ